MNGWESTGTSGGGRRRYWVRSNPDVPFESLAAASMLNPAESHQWARPEPPEECGLDSSSRHRCFSVPNVFLVADLMGYGTIADAFITTFGGRLGSLFTHAPGRRRVLVRQAADMHAALHEYAGDLWGFVIYAHGSRNGYVHATRKGPPITTAEKIRAGLTANGFQLSKLWMMHCHSAANGRDKFWDSLSHRPPTYYYGINAFGIDFK